MTNFPQLAEDLDQGLTATIHTSKGDIKVKLFKDQAPKTVENFVQHAKDDYYNGVIFHRVIQDFMIQGGDPTGTGAGGESIYGGPFQDEFSRELFNLNGALSMANAGPNTNGSQFFIVTANSVPANMIEQMKEAGYPDDIQTAYYDNGGTPWLDFRHTVFGQVIEGLDVVEAIEKVETDPADKPLEEVIIESISVSE